MLELKNIKKDYVTDSNTTVALNGINLSFRRNEFVSILGPSGCGKTTLLNIIGGLDRYTSGDLIINGKSTKEYKDKDWDTYRNHTIGFVFQSYNLIMHLTVEENVELALTLSGVNDQERKIRTKEVLEKVGLLDKAKSLPNQLSGGQMQRVAIARALINDPEILLADEPTGALDSTTGIQIMGLLKEIAKDKLVVMVTHNPELALEYSTRIIKIKDGEIISDSDPVVEKLEVVKEENQTNKTHMSFFTALKLSFKNMLTKKARTILVSFAGSIGIIGIALILSMSAGFQNYIDDIQEKALAEYPLTITSSQRDYSFIMNIIQDVTTDSDEEKSDKIVVSNILAEFSKQMLQSEIKNDLESFKTFLDGNNEIQNITTDIIYTYESSFYVYPENKDPNSIYPLPKATGMQGYANWVELLDSESLLENKYELLAGSWPKEYNEIVLIVNYKGEVSDICLYMLGERTYSDLIASMDGSIAIDEYAKEYNLDYFLGKELNMVVKSDFYERNTDTTDPNKIFKKVASFDVADKELAKIIEDKSEALKIVGVIKPNSSSALDFSTFLGGIGHINDLKLHVVEKNMQSPIITEQLKHPTMDIVKGTEITASLNSTQEEQFRSVLRGYGYADIKVPDNIQIYPKSFADKERIVEIIDEYNNSVPKAKQITYTDDVEIMISSVSEIVDAVSYVLIAFVSVSLIVSSIMIGVITYISVLERTREIGVLRSIGASKKDISRVFNAETLIIGFLSGVFGIGVSLLLLLPINVIIEYLTKVPNMGQLPLVGAISLIIISTCLTLIAGIVPSMIAAKKDPVVALRTE
ncbi:MAG: ABC transporter ATP-binding protein/permease [Bacilli bacterium]|nr:ABC transporter ATP-binding protein/permease [Bacilli bacterium]